MPLTGGVDVSIGDTTFELAGRESVFTAVTDTAYLPINSAGPAEQPGRRHHRAARCPGRPRAAVPVPAGVAAVDVSLRGSGSRTRQVNNFGMGTGMECVKMLATEVLTPASNWSSYPPHKHDENNGTETELEEIYYYRFASAAPAEQTAPAQAKAVGYQRVYGTAERPIEVLEEVTDGDTVLIPHGWHGPSHRLAVASHVLPERDGRTRRGTRLGDQ